MQGAALQRAQEVAVRRPKARTEGGRDRAEVRLLADQDAGLPRLEAIDVRRLDRTLRMIATRLAAVFDIHPEDHPMRVLLVRARSVRVWREDAQTGEDDRIGVGRGRRLAAQ